MQINRSDVLKDILRDNQYNDDFLVRSVVLLPSVHGAVISQNLYARLFMLKSQMNKIVFVSVSSA